MHDSMTRFDSLRVYLPFDEKGTTVTRLYSGEPFDLHQAS